MLRPLKRALQCAPQAASTKWESGVQVVSQSDCRLPHPFRPQVDQSSSAAGPRLAPSRGCQTPLPTYRVAPANRLRSARNMRQVQSRRKNTTKQKCSPEPSRAPSPLSHPQHWFRSQNTGYLALEGRHSLPLAAGRPSGRFRFDDPAGPRSDGALALQGMSQPNRNHQRRWSGWRRYQRRASARHPRRDVR